MTNTSLMELQAFLHSHQHHFWNEMRIADYGGTDNIGTHIVRDMLAGADMKNYHMLDFDNGVDLREPIKGEKFDLGICMDLLEHVSNPFVVVRNIIDSLNPGAFLYVTAPFVWEIHGYPNDYWRFTPDAFAELFKEMEIELIYVEEDAHKDPEEKPQVVPVNRPFTRVIGIFRKNGKEMRL